MFSQPDVYAHVISKPVADFSYRENTMYIRCNLLSFLELPRKKKAEKDKKRNQRKNA